ncbi:MAG: hypothetical protein RSB91_02340 [Clostridia bacterium]
MQKYKRKTPAASAADKLLRALVAAGLGVGWFVYLWGLSLPALAAGLAMGGLIWLCVRLFGKKSVQKREAQMRRMIGGELAVNKLLLLPPRHAAFQATIWLLPKAPIQMQKAVEWGVLGLWEAKNVFVRLIAQHESLPISVQQVIDVVKEARTHHADSCILCLTAPLSREASTYAGSAQPTMRVVARDELIGLAGLCSPATDEELSALAHKKKARRSAKEWARVVLSPDRARRYFWYGLTLAALAFLTGQWTYPIPAALCLGLFAACKAREFRAESGKWGV